MESSTQQPQERPTEEIALDISIDCDNQYNCGFYLRRKIAQDVKEALDAERQRAEEAIYKELQRFNAMSVTEVAAQNQSVFEYCKHWEQRVEKAEAKLTESQREVEGAKKSLSWYKSLFDYISKFLVPGECDSVDALQKIVKEHCGQKQTIERLTAALKYYALMPKGHALGDGCGHQVAIEALHPDLSKESQP